jgi:ABC-type antimicrobial peptide transport system permease subunit
VDERFWTFHALSKHPAPSNRELYVSRSLAQELGTSVGTIVLLTFEKPSEVPLESLYGKKNDRGRTLRLTVGKVLGPGELGDFELRAQQGAVRAVFVPLQLLQQELEQTDKVNTILIAQKDPETETKVSALEDLLRQTAKLDDYGLALRTLETNHAVSLERTSTLLTDSLADHAQETAKDLSLRTVPVFSYVANSISSGNKSIPYSLVTAIQDETFAQMSGEESVDSKVPLVLNEWAARDLGASTGDPVTLEYYVWHNDGRLETKTANFQLKAIVPIDGIAADRNLVPDYPGISESPSLADWDPPFPVSLDRIRQQDEDYWDQYRTTPKAFIPLTAGQQLWQSRYGRLTSVRVLGGPDKNLEQTKSTYEQQLLAKLNPAAMGFMVIPARSQGLNASQGATDFGEYFLYFSFFLVVSALLLTALFFRLGVEQRLREIGLLQAVGIPAKNIRRMFLCEGFFLALVGTVLGLLGALLYGGLIMYGLRTWWVDAVGTTELSLQVSPWSLLLGAIGGIIVALGCIVWTLRQVGKASTRSLLAATAVGIGETVTARKGRLVSSLNVAILLSVLGLSLLLAATFQLVGQVAGFFGGGTLLLISLICYQAAWLRSSPAKDIRGSGWWSLSRLGFRNLTYRPGRSVLCITLIAAAAFIIVSVDAFRRGDRGASLDPKSGNGGFPLLAESLLPLVHDPNSAEGREAMNLNSGSDALLLDQISFVRFRLKPGDDASCLNLYQPQEPRILGVSDDFISRNRFLFQKTIATGEETQNPWQLLNRDLGEGVVPVIADANSLNYVLHLGLGDEFVLQGNQGPVRLRIVGALSDSVFQSEFLMSEKNFVRLFPHEEGHRFFLIDAPGTDQTATVVTLEDRLSDFGFDVTPTNERLANFHRVENTYLSTFQMLGGLGLLLGTFGLGAVLLRNVLERRRELALLRAVGYNPSHLMLMVVAENALLLFCGLVTGTLSALLAIAPVFFERGGRLPNPSLSLLLAAVLISGLIVSLIATRAALRSPLLPALRAE